MAKEDDALRKIRERIENKERQRIAREDARLERARKLMRTRFEKKRKPKDKK
jgi:hypothetical protein